MTWRRPFDSLMNAGNVVVNRPAAEPGLAVLEAGGDFADGAIAYEGPFWAAKHSCPSTSRCCPCRAKPRGC
jgi:hypothetical protein